MSTNIPVLFNTSFSPDSGWSSSKGWMNIDLNSSTGTNSAASGGGDPLNRVVVLDRKNPNAAPVFQANAPDNTTVPPGLDAFLTTDYMMFWASAAFVTQMPQGALYDMLNKNGGGAQLAKMETLSTKFACGINGGLVYMMASIPAAGVSGLEFLEHRTGSTSGGANPVYCYKNAPFQMLLELVPSPNGMYTPVNPY